MLANNAVDLSGALRLAEQAVETDSNDVWAWVALGDMWSNYLHLDASAISKAEQAYRRSILVEPTAAAWLDLGWLYAWQGNFDKARAAYRTAALLDPNDPISRGSLFWLGVPLSDIP